MRLEDEDPRDEITSTPTIGDRLRAAAARLRDGIVTAATGVHELADRVMPAAPPTLAEDLASDFASLEAIAARRADELRQAEETERARVQQELETRARAAAGEFASGMQGQREGRPLFENGTHTICANCGAIRRVEHCIWTDTSELVGTQFVRDISGGTGMGELVTRQAGWCHACAGLIPTQPAPLPRRPDPPVDWAARRAQEMQRRLDAQRQREEERERARRERTLERRRVEDQRRLEREEREERQWRARERAATAPIASRGKRLITLEDE